MTPIPPSPWRALACAVLLWGGLAAAASAAEPPPAGTEAPAAEAPAETAPAAAAEPESAPAPEVIPAATPAPEAVSPTPAPQAKAPADHARPEARPKARPAPAVHEAPAHRAPPAPAPRAVPVAEAAPGARPAAADGTALGAAWDGVRKAVDGDGPAFDAAVQALVAARDAAGLDNLESAGAALADWAARAVARGDANAAEHLSRAAVRVAPGAPEGYLVRAHMYWADGHPAAAAGWTARAAATGLGHYWVGLAWLGYGVIVFWFAAATALVVLLAPGLIQGMRTFHHQLREYAGFRVPSAWVLAGCLALLVLPVAAGWGPGWTVLLWAAAAWAGDPARDRRVQVLLLMAVLVGPWLCAPALAPSRPPSAPVELALLEANDALPAAAVPPPDALPVADDGWRVAFALGNAALRDGAYDEAIAWYRHAQSQGGDAKRLAHNVATAQFRAGRFEEAERGFKALAEGGQAGARTWFDLGQAQSRRLDFEAARVSFDRAQKENADLYLRISRTAGERDDFFVVPYPVSNGDARTMLLSGEGGWGELAGPLWGFLFAGLPVWAAPLLLAGAGALAWLLPRLLRNRRVYRCDVCRATVCQDCMQFVYDAHLCRPCGDRLAETRGTPADLAFMRDRRRRLAAPVWPVAARLVPGLHDLARGRYGRACLHLTVLAFVVWWTVLLNTIPAWAMATPVAGWPVVRLGGALLVAAHVAWSWFASGRRARHGPARDPGATAA